MAIPRNIGGPRKPKVPQEDNSLYPIEKKTFGQIVDEAIRFYVENHEKINKTDSPQYFGYQKCLDEINEFVNDLKVRLESKINGHTHPRPISEIKFK